MNSMKRTYSNLSISSIISDSAPNNDDPEITARTNSMLKILLEAVSETNSENTALGSEVLDILSTLKFDVKSLFNDFRDGTQAAKAISKSEGLPSIDEAALQICLEKRKLQNKKKEREERLLKARYNAAFAKYNALQEKLNRIRKEIELIEDTLQLKMSNDENIESERILRSKKLHEYRETIKKLENELHTLHSEEIELDKTLGKSTLIMEKLDELKQLNSSLERYGDLAPNLLQARNILEGKQRELQEIENLISDKMYDY